MVDVIFFCKEKKTVHFVGEIFFSHFEYFAIIR